MAASLKTEAAGRSSEPSMEDILASIRKIISDEDAKPADKPAADVKPVPAKPEPPRTVVPPQPESREQSQDDIDALMAGFEAEAEAPSLDADVLELTEEMAEPAFEPEPAPVARTPEPPRPAPVFQPAPEAPFEERLISAATNQAISSAFGNLTHTILAQNARTLDDLVQDMLRPMLKTWLDDNLPTLVERLVRAEIERVSRGGR